MNQEFAVALAQAIRNNWNRWGDLRRGAAIVMLRETGVSHRKLTIISRCSEGLIRYIEIVGRLPVEWKQYLVAGPLDAEGGSGVASPMPAT